MIRHIVMWRVTGESRAHRLESAQIVQKSFEELRGHIPGMLSLEVGLDISGVDCACDVVLMTKFESQEALAAYATHPAHLRVRRQLGDIRTARYQVDYPVDQATEATAAGGAARGKT